MERTTGIKDKHGDLQREPGTITESFAQFYEELFKELEGRGDYSNHDTPHATPVTAEEVQRALRQLKSGKKAADDGLVAEMF